MKYIHTVCVYTHSSESIESNPINLIRKLLESYPINLISKLLENSLLISK